MIIRENEDSFVLVTQHDHAQLSGEVAKHFTEPYFVDDSYRDEVVLAIREHDRGWIRLDDVPMWNDRDTKPFSFMDYPLLPKLTHYRLGIDEVQSLSEYAALLCSMHYCSFMAGHTPDQTDIVRFVADEHERQRLITDKIVMPSVDIVRKHFGLLQLCDDISLYVCLNKPGVSKEEEHPWYAAGFRKSEGLGPAGQGKLVARWVSEREIGFDPMPFKGGFTAKLRLKVVQKEIIKQEGLQEAYRGMASSEQLISFVGE